MSRLIDINLFAGAGGSCLGHYLATGRYIDVAVNHDPVAVEVHAYNNPHTEHYVQNVYHVSPYVVAGGRPVGTIWASPDCTYHSVARGSAPIRDVPRRDLPFVISGKWLPALKPVIFYMENVKEILGWGPLDADGKIVQAAKGDYWRSFIRQIRRLGYRVEWRVLRACDYGVATTRERLYLIARRDGRPIVWPEPTHGAPDSPEVLSGELLPYRKAAEFIDWTLPCPSIFESAAEIKAKYGLTVRRPLKDASLRRIARGMQRFVLDNPTPFVVHYFGDKGQDVFRGTGADEPLSAVTAGGNRHGLVMPYIATLAHSKTTGRGQYVYGMEEPLRTIAATPSHALVMPMAAPFLFGTGGPKYAGKPSRADKPLGVVLAENHKAVAVAHLVRDFGCSVGSACDAPAPTVMATGQGKTAVAMSWLAKMRGSNLGLVPGEPLHTLTAGGSHFAAVYAFLQQYNGKSIGFMPDKPLHTSRCKEAFGVVPCRVDGQTYAVADIGMRMLQPYEQAGCMGFPPTYRLDRTHAGPVKKEDQNRLIGNAVCPDMAKILYAANPLHDDTAAWELPRHWQLPFFPSREASMEVVC